jgi:hypothetical protein
VNRRGAGFVVGLLVAAYPSPEWPPSTVELYSTELERLPFEDVAVGESVRGLIRGRVSGYRPSPGEVVRYVVGNLVAVPTFEEAWAEMRARASEGPYDRPDVPPGFSHPLVEALALAVGWRAFTGSRIGDTYFESAARQAFEHVRDGWMDEFVRHPELPGRGQAVMEAAVKGGNR